MRQNVLLLVLAGLIVSGLSENAYCGHRFGGGLHYLRTLGDIKDYPEFDENSIGFIASYQFTLPVVRFEGDLEWIPDYGGSEKSMWQPQAWVLIGSFIYGSGGIGIGYFNDDWQDNPFYALRLGVDVGLGGLGLDIFATYRFRNAKVFEDFESKDLDSITFGAILRF